MLHAQILLAAALLLCAVAIAAAEGTNAAPPAAPEEVSLQGYATASPRCLEWTDGCATCLRGDAGAECSTPGIACQPGPIVCRRENEN